MVLNNFFTINRVPNRLICFGIKPSSKHLWQCLALSLGHTKVTFHVITNQQKIITLVHLREKPQLGEQRKHRLKRSIQEFMEYLLYRIQHINLQQIQPAHHDWTLPVRLCLCVFVQIVPILSSLNTALLLQPSCPDAATSSTTFCFWQLKNKLLPSHIWIPNLSSGWLSGYRHLKTTAHCYNRISRLFATVLLVH